MKDIKNSKSELKSEIYLFILNLLIGLILGISVYLSTPNYLNKIEILAWAILCVFACFGFVAIAFKFNPPYYIEKVLSFIFDRFDGGYPD